MYAVIRTGGKQYKVAEGDVIKIEKLAGQAGDAVTFDQVLALGDDGGLQVGTPVLDGASVSAELLEQIRGEKIIVFKKKRRKNYRRKRGHRQYLTVLRVTDIAADAEQRRAAAKEPEAPEVTTAPAAPDAPESTEEYRAWHTRKPAVRPETDGSRRDGASASRNTAARR